MNRERLRLRPPACSSARTGFSWAARTARPRRCQRLSHPPARSVCTAARAIRGQLRWRNPPYFLSMPAKGCSASICASPARPRRASRGPSADPQVPCLTSGSTINAGDDAAAIAGNERLGAGAGVTDAAGNFTLLGIPPGQYRLRAWTVHVDGRTPSPLLPVSRPGIAPGGVTLWADVPVTVVATAVSDVTLRLAPPPRVSGQLVFEGSGTPPSATQFALALQPRQPFDTRLCRQPAEQALTVRSSFRAMRLAVTGSLSW